MRKYKKPTIETIEIGCATMLADSKTGKNGSISPDGKANFNSDGEYATANNTWEEAY